ncbi:MAG: hypothetical protein QHJ81_16085 [Anaerolineae bacterium]|nr:hypothetical protein [Anaerolineae bacterium]
MTRMTISEAKRILPRLLDEQALAGELIVEAEGEPRLVVIGAQEYGRFVEWRRREAIRSWIFAEMDRRRAEPWWNEDFRFFEDLRERASDLSEEELIALVEEATQAAHQEDISAE